MKRKEQQYRQIYHNFNDQQKKNEQNIDLIKEMIKTIEQDLYDIENLSLQIHFRPLTIR